MYGPLDAESLRGEQHRYGLLATRIAQLLNAGMRREELKFAIENLPRNLAEVNLLPGWFYWATRIEEGPVEEEVCTHYFLNRGSEQCLVWQEDTYVEIVPCEEVGIIRTHAGMAGIAHVEHKSPLGG
jgi:hypothetical protein